MRFCILFTLFSLLSFTPTTLTSPATDCLSEYCPNHLDPRDPRIPTPTPTPTSRLTNGERLARGLPINPPTRRPRHHGVSARHAAPSAHPQATKRGIIKVTDIEKRTTLGYISKNSLGGAQTCYQPSQDDALVVELAFKSGVARTGSVRITAENSDMAGFPLLAVIQGRDNADADLFPGSYHYGYIGGMALPGAPANSVPVHSPENSYHQISVRVAHSEVWNFDSDTNELIPHWINSDGSKASTTCFSQDSALYIGGDVDAYRSRFPTPVVTVSFDFVLL